MSLARWLILACLAGLIFPGCTLTSFDKKHGNWSEELQDLREGRERIDHLVVSCRSRFDPQGLGRYTREEFETAFGQLKARNRPFISPSPAIRNASGSMPATLPRTLTTFCLISGGRLSAS